MAAKGKKLESKIKAWLTHLEIYHQRFFDAKTAGGYAPPQPADYWVWISPRLIFIECKETAEASLSFANFRPTQLKSALSGHKNKIEHLVLVEIRKRLYGVNFELLLPFLKKGDKSVPETWFLNNASFLSSRHEFETFINIK